MFKAILLGVLGIVGVSGLGLMLTAKSTDDRIGGAIMLVVMIGVGLGVLITFSTLTLTVEPEEVVVRYGRSPFTSRVRLAQVTDADKIEVRFMQWGGFGYRGSRRLMKRAAIVARTGEAVRIHLDDGTWLAVTVDHADRAARTILAARGE